MLPLVAVDGRVGSITDLEKIPARKIETIQIFPGRMYSVTRH